jgi:hypothetical protein
MASRYHNEDDSLYWEATVVLSNMSNLGSCSLGVTSLDAATNTNTVLRPAGEIHVVHVQIACIVNSSAQKPVLKIEIKRPSSFVHSSIRSCDFLYKERPLSLQLCESLGKLIHIWDLAAWPALISSIDLLTGVLHLLRRLQIRRAADFGSDVIRAG